MHQRWKAKNHKKENHNSTSWVRNTVYWATRQINNVPDLGPARSGSKSDTHKLNWGIWYLSSKNIPHYIFLILRQLLTPYQTTWLVQLISINFQTRKITCEWKKKNDMGKGDNADHWNFHVFKLFQQDWAFTLRSLSLKRPHYVRKWPIGWRTNQPTKWLIN